MSGIQNPFVITYTLHWVLQWCVFTCLYLKTIQNIWLVQFSLQQRRNFIIYANLHLCLLVSCIFMPDSNAVRAENQVYHRVVWESKSAHIQNWYCYKMYEGKEKKVLSKYCWMIIDQPWKDYVLIPFQIFWHLHRLWVCNSILETKKLRNPSNA